LTAWALSFTSRLTALAASLTSSLVCFADALTSSLVCLTDSLASSFFSSAFLSSSASVGNLAPASLCVGLGSGSGATSETCGSSGRAGVWLTLLSSFEGSSCSDDFTPSEVSVSGWSAQSRSTEAICAAASGMSLVRDDRTHLVIDIRQTGELCLSGKVSLEEILGRMGLLRLGRSC
jgi:hypothetical protein